MDFISKNVDNASEEVRKTCLNLIILVYKLVGAKKI